MSEIQLLVPDLGDDGKAEVIEILLKEGDSVGEEEIIVVLESDKATMEIPCESSGTIKTLHVKLGDEVATGELLATIETGQAQQPEEKSKTGSVEADESGENNEEKTEVIKVNDDSLAEDAKQPHLVVETVPDTGSEESAELIELNCKVGSQVNAEDILFVLESDKATMEIPASVSGKVTKVFVKTGDQLSFGNQLCEIETTDSQASRKPSAQVFEEIDDEQIVEQELPQGYKPQAQASNQVVASQSDSKYRNPSVHAGPAARRLARELGVDLSLVKPSGPKERILKDDIKAFVKINLNKVGGNANPIFDFELPDIDFSKFGEIEKQKLSRIKKVSAKNLSRSWLTIPHVTQFDEANITELEAFRKKQSAALKKQDIKLTPLAFLVKASAITLKEFPRFNASLDKQGDNLILKKYVHIGVAVDTEEGLLVPVIRDADNKSVKDIALELAEISEKARNKKLMPQDMQGACFSISSLGGIGGTAFTPIVNWPEVAILGVSRSQIKPVYDGKAFVPGLMLPLSLSYDHRVIDGAEAVRFTRYLADTLESEKLLTID